jgi:hypothetical protein
MPACSERFRAVQTAARPRRGSCSCRCVLGSSVRRCVERMFCTPTAFVIWMHRTQTAGGPRHDNRGARMRVFAAACGKGNKNTVPRHDNRGGPHAGAGPRGNSYFAALVCARVPLLSVGVCISLRSCLTGGDCLCARRVARCGWRAYARGSLQMRAARGSLRSGRGGRRGRLAPCRGPLEGARAGGNPRGRWRRIGTHERLAAHPAHCVGTRPARTLAGRASPALGDPASRPLP